MVSCQQEFLLDIINLQLSQRGKFDVNAGQVC